MSRIAGLVQLKTGDAVSGIVSRRARWFTYLRVEMAELHDAATRTTTKADGSIFILKSNVIFVQQLVRIADEAPRGPAALPGPLTSSGQPKPSARDAGDAQR